MALAEDDISTFRMKVEEAKWSPEMNKLMEALEEKKDEATKEAKKLLWDCLDNYFEMPTSDISDFIKTCMKDHRHAGYKLVQALNILLENTPS